MADMTPTSPSVPTSDQSGTNSNIPTPNQANGANSAAPDPNTLDGFFALVRESSSGGSSNPSTPTGQPSTEQPLDLVAFANDSEGLDKLASKISFTDILPQDIREGIAQGNVTSVMQAMEAMSRQAYRTALQHAVLASGQGVQSHQKALPSTIDARVAEVLKRQTLEASIPESAHPATGFVLKQIAEGLVSKGLSPKEAMSSAANVLRDMGLSLVQPTAADKQQAAAAKVSWDTWLDS